MLKHNCRHLLKLGVSGAMLLSSLPMVAKRPNVIYVFPDQLRNAAMGFWQDSTYSKHINWRPDPTFTPNLNRFASQSFVFASALSNCPVSSAHRGMLLTGLYPNQSGVSLNCHANRPISDLRDDVTCISDIFHQAGYHCAYFGKLHAHHPIPNNPQAPGTYVNQDQPCWDAYTPPERRHGFEDWYSYGTFDEHKNPHYWGNHGEYFEPHAYSPIHEADTIVGYLKAHRDSDEPVFLMWGLNPPHSPYLSLNDCEEQDLAIYRNIPLDSLLVRENISDELADKRACAPYYFANVTGVDRAFGHLLAALDSLGMSDNTIVVFASDHGETMCSHVRDPKNSIYTESVNIPFMIRYPGHISPLVSDELFSAIDIMPTIVSLAGLKRQLPDSLPGYDWSRYLLHRKNKETLPESVLYLRNIDGQKDRNGLVRSYFGDCRGVITKRYSFAITLHKNGTTKETLLFDNQQDPYQLHNIPLQEQPELVRQLLNQLGGLLQQAKDPWWEDGTYERVCQHIHKKLATPNVIVLIGDDVGYGDLGWIGSKTVETPNVNHLADQGIRFTNCHATSSTSTPSRYGLLTGLYPWRRDDTGIAAGNAAMIIHPEQYTLADLFTQAGYHTAAIGKWHLGLGEQQGTQNWNDTIHPNLSDIGFQYSYIMAATADRVPCVFIENGHVVNLDPNDPIEVDYTTPFPDEPIYPTHSQLCRVHPSDGHACSIVDGIPRIGYMKGGLSARWHDENLADSITEHAVRYITAHQQQPFFLYLGTNDIHVPRVPHERFQGKTTMGPRGDAIVQFDYTVGRITHLLDSLGIADNTILILTSDNGPVVDDGYRDFAVERLGEHQPTGGLRGGKYSIFEAGTRVPCVVRWPGHTTPGQWSDAAISLIDLIPSMATMLGMELPKGAAKDGENHLSDWLGQNEKGREYIVEQNLEGTLSITIDGYKYIEPSNGSPYNPNVNIELGNHPYDQLYYLPEDPNEQHNLAEEQPELVMQLKDKLQCIKNK